MMKVPFAHAYDKTSSLAKKLTDTFLTKRSYQKLNHRLMATEKSKQTLTVLLHVLCSAATVYMHMMI